MLGFLCLVALLSSVTGEHLEFVDLFDNGVSPVCLTANEAEALVYDIEPAIQLGSRSTHNPLISRNGKIFILDFEGPDKPTGSFGYQSYNNIIAPFWDESYFESDGSVCYSIHDSDLTNPGSYVTTYALRSKVGNFIHSSVGYEATVQSLLVVEWRNMKSTAFYPKTNTFQALIAVTLERTYAIFIYKCGELQWSTSSAVIGFNAADGIYRNHPFSRNSSNPNPVACANSPASLWTNVVYRIDTASPCYRFGCTTGDCIDRRQVCDGIYQCIDKSDEIACSPGVKCPPEQFGCHNGDCIDSTLRCNGAADCRDSSDEINCSLNSGHIAGIVIGSLLLVLVMVVLVVVFVIQQVKHRNRRLAQFRVLRESIQPPTTPTTRPIHFHPKPGEWYRTAEGTMVQGPPPAYKPLEEVELIGGAAESQTLIEGSERPIEPAALSQPAEFHSTIEEDSSHEPSNEVGVANDEGNSLELNSSGSFESESMQLISET